MSEKENTVSELICSVLKSHWFLVGVIIILLGTIVACLIPTVKYNDFAVILGFVGVLATFVVISNYAQVWEVKRENKKLKNEIEHNKHEVMADVFYLTALSFVSSKNYGLAIYTFILSIQEHSIINNKHGINGVLRDINNKIVQVQDIKPESILQLTTKQKNEIQETLRELSDSNIVIAKIIEYVDKIPTE